MTMKLLSAPSLMMAAVAGLGLYAAYRMTKADSSSGGEDAGTTELTGSPLKLMQNRYYRGRLTMGSLPPFLSTATREELFNTLQMLGFSNVRVFMTIAELPPDWALAAKAGANSESRWFEGQWRLNSASVPRPANLERIWISKPPGNATYVTSTAKVSGDPDYIGPFDPNGLEAMQSPYGVVMTPEVDWVNPVG